MLRITMSDSAEGATKYFDAALATSDYYQKDQGLWGGKGAEMLGLGSNVTRGQFIALASNMMPGTGQTLTVRNKEKRTPGYDLCFSVPKSISIYLAETKDQLVEQMVGEAFTETMADVEQQMETRIRIGGQDAAASPAICSMPGSFTGKPDLSTGCLIHIFTSTPMRLMRRSITRNSAGKQANL
jgi:conjugative relaxase-like TrwC/TraI family protein